MLYPSGPSQTWRTHCPSTDLAHGHPQGLCPNPVHPQHPSRHPKLTRRPQHQVHYQTLVATQSLHHVRAMLTAVHQLYLVSADALTRTLGLSYTSSSRLFIDSLHQLYLACAAWSQHKLVICLAGIDSHTAGQRNRVLQMKMRL
jgi:hypothetical protein